MENHPMCRLIMLVAILAVPAVCVAKIIHVPADRPSIQDGINVAFNGDTILVAPGTYVENIDFLGKAITLKSSHGAEWTTIDGGSPYPADYSSVVKFISGEGKQTVLDGFTITNGTGVPYDKSSSSSTYGYRGGGIRCKATSPTIINNVISGNKAQVGGGIYCSELSCAFIAHNTISGNESELGGGFACYESSPVLLNNEITENIADESGGGIYCVWLCAPIIKSNVITGNLSGLTGLEVSGGGIFLKWGFHSVATILNNVIMSNISGVGGGIASYKSSQLVVNNIISGNMASTGGGIELLQSTGTRMINNTVFDNSASFGGGICVEMFTRSAKITNTIIWDNKASGQGSEICLMGIIHKPCIQIDYSNVDRSTGSVYATSGSILWGSGMIESDPLFVDPDNNDFNLLYTSPCRNAGDNSAVTERFDYRGDPRIAHGTVDMGADEFHNNLYCIGDFTPNGQIEGKLIGLPGTSPIGLFFGSGFLDPPSHHTWGNFYLVAPWFMVPLGLSIPADGILKLPKTIPVTPVAPYDVYMQALIGLDFDSLTNLFVLEVR
ncbi:MAG: right-handed parallel beta-helix repeat-containing protein [Planctomycetota bacterium]